MNVFGQLIRVTRVRSQGIHGFGGCIFVGVSINSQGDILDAKSHCVVKASNAVLGPVIVQPGQWWSVSGELKPNTIKVNTYALTEWQIEAKGLEMVLPSGEHIISFMAESDAFAGVGEVKSRKLWEVFGESLYEILDQGDVASLSSVLTEECARGTVSAWALHGDARTLRWLAQQGIELAVGRKLVEFFGTAAQEKIEEDPYRLLSYCSSWKKTDVLARQSFEIAEDDPRRLLAAIEEACHRMFDAGHTTMTVQGLSQYIESILGVQTQEFRWRALVPEAISSGYTNGSFLIDEELSVFPIGPWVMERTVSRAIAKRILPGHLRPLMSQESVLKLLTKYEQKEGIELNYEQRLAVLTAAANQFCLITGGAGVGKTTVLKALYEIYDEIDVKLFQLALAGRAAKRMTEATGRPATTLASFLKNFSDEEFSGPTVVVVDEASMVDIVTFYRLCERLPNHVWIVLVGDPNQLMPVGPGLVLHALERTVGVPRVELLIVKRYQGVLKAAAESVREGCWPSLSDELDAAIAFIPCTLPDVAETVLNIFLQAPDDTQILCPRKSGPDGTKHLNLICQSRLTAKAPALQVWNSEFNTWANTGFNLGDPLICTRNLWDRGLQNGSLGKIVEFEASPRLLSSADGEEIGYVIAWVDWDDGERRPIFESMLDDMELGYAITVHKAQGSQWRRIIVPLSSSRVLDRTLVYTALTRAQVQAFLIGDETAAKKAVENKPKAELRQVALGHFVATALREESVTA